MLAPCAMGVARGLNVSASALIGPKYAGVRLSLKGRLTHGFLRPGL
jgi:hypothetical protein